MSSSRKALLLVLLILSAAGAVTAAYLAYGRNPTTGTTSLPAQCARPPGGYLMVANSNGFNDSIDHGVPTNAWPVMEVRSGSTVSITVCNTDTQAHGFQITHYFDGTVETIAPGKALTVTFTADKTGTFTIYCSIFCTVHSFMQSGKLVVS